MAWVLLWHPWVLAPWQVTYSPAWQPQAQGCPGLHGYLELQATEQEGVGPADLPTPDGSQPGACYCRGLSSPNKQHQTPRYGGPHGGSCPAPCSQSLVPAATSPLPVGHTQPGCLPGAWNCQDTSPPQEKTARAGQATRHSPSTRPSPSLGPTVTQEDKPACQWTWELWGARPGPCTASSGNSGSLHNQDGGSRPM